MKPTWNAKLNIDEMVAGYRRLMSNEKFTPPYTWSGEVRLHEVMDPPVFGIGWRTGQTATYEPKLNWHPLYPSNDRNIVIGVGAVKNPTVFGISAEMRDVRPEKPYGVRTGYELRDRRSLEQSPVGDGWHDFTWKVPSNYEYALDWDGERYVTVVEELPATIGLGPVHLGLRLDFLHVEFRNMVVEPFCV